MKVASHSKLRRRGQIPAIQPARRSHRRARACAIGRRRQFALRRGARPENAPFEGAFLQEFGVGAADIDGIGGRPPGLRPSTGRTGFPASPRRMKPQGPETPTGPSGRKTRRTPGRRRARNNKEVARKRETGKKKDKGHETGKLCHCRRDVRRNALDGLAGSDCLSSRRADMRSSAARRPIGGR